LPPRASVRLSVRQSVSQSARSVVRPSDAGLARAMGKQATNIAVAHQMRLFHCAAHLPI
jgi:hypothetical protein